METLLRALLVTLLLVPTGCEIFIMDYGEDDMPCLEDGNCAKGYICIDWRCADDSTPGCNSDEECFEPMGTQEARCSWEHRCFIPYGKGFGNTCTPWKNDCRKPFGLCHCFGGPDQDCRCTKECHDIFDCGGGPSTIRCTQVFPNDVYKVCAEPGLNDGIGSLCTGDDEFHCGPAPEQECVMMMGGDYEFCTRQCPGPGDMNDCPLPMECAVPPGLTGHFCGFASWFGFNYDSSGNEFACEDKFPMTYPFRFDTGEGYAFCTRECPDGFECPESAHCETGHVPHICLPD